MKGAADAPVDGLIGTEEAAERSGKRKRIFRVFLSDVHRMRSNVVAVVIVMGLSIIPALYAWFNIMSNWDVYGEAATSQMHVAVYSEDAGFRREVWNSTSETR